MVKEITGGDIDADMPSDDGRSSILVSELRSLFVVAQISVEHMNKLVCIHLLMHTVFYGVN